MAKPKSIKKDDILELKTRRKIYQYILKNPGLHLRELSRRLKIPITTLSYHINYLKKRGLIIGKTKGCFVRYYVINKVGSNDKELLSLLRNKTIHQIILILYYDVVTSRIEISEMLEKHPNTIAFHLKKLQDMDIIEPAEVGDGVVISSWGTVIERFPVGREIIYRFKNAELLWDILITYQESYLDGFLTKLILDSIMFHGKDEMPKRLKTLDAGIDSAIELAFEFFPIPFCA